VLPDYLCDAVIGGQLGMIVRCRSYLGNSQDTNIAAARSAKLDQVAGWYNGCVTRGFYLVMTIVRLNFYGLAGNLAGWLGGVSIRWRSHIDPGRVPYRSIWAAASRERPILRNLPATGKDEDQATKGRES
jgi:hypothetical protein